VTLPSRQYTNSAGVSQRARWRPPAPARRRRGAARRKAPVRLLGMLVQALCPAPGRILAGAPPCGLVRSAGWSWPAFMDSRSRRSPA